MERVKICPKCGAEYYPDILECADCHVALQWAQEIPRLPAEQAEDLSRREEDRWWGVTDEPPDVNRSDGWDLFAPDEILGQLTSDIERIQNVYRKSLAKAGIPSAILPTTCFQPATDYLEESVISGNRHVVVPAGQVPVGDALGGFQYDLFVRRADFARAQEIIEELFAELHPDLEGGFYREYEAGRCPACGAELAEEAVACPDCGLPFVDEKDTED